MVKIFNLKYFDKKKGRNKIEYNRKQEEKETKFEYCFKESEIFHKKNTVCFEIVTGKANFVVVVYVVVVVFVRLLLFCLFLGNCLLIHPEQTV